MKYFYDLGLFYLSIRRGAVYDREEGDLISLYDGDNYTTINNPSTYKNMYAQLKQLINMIENDFPAKPSLEEARSAFAAACAFEMAAKTGKPYKSINQLIRI